MVFDPLSKKHSIWKEVAIATLPGLLAIILQKLLEEAFEYLKRSNCECKDEDEEPTEETKNDNKKKN